MSRKFRKTVASTLALAMMAGSVSSMPAVQLSSIVQAAVTGATVTVNSETTTVKPGDTFTVTCDVTDNAEGFNALLAWLDYNRKAFELVSWENGAGENDDDPVYNNVTNPTKDGSNYQGPDADIATIVQMYFDSSGKNLTGNCTISRITFKVLEGASGKYTFSVGSDPELGENGQKKDAQNRIVAGQKDPVVCEPVYKSLEITVAAEGEVTTPSVTTTKAPETTAASQTDKPAETTVVSQTEKPAETTAEVIPAEAIVIELGEATLKDNEDGSKTATLPIYAKNIGNGISTVQFNYEMDSSFTVDRVNKGEFECQWTPGTESKTLQFLTGDGCNIPNEGIIGKVKINVPAGTPDGVYPVKISNFEGSTYDVENDRQIPLENSAFYGVAGKIVIGEATSETTPSASETKPSTTVAEPTPSAPVTTVSDIEVEPTDTPSNPIDKPGGESDVPGGIKALKLDAGKYEVNAGDEFKLKIKVTDNAEGFNTLLTMLEFDNDVFEVGGHVAGDEDDPENEDSDIYNSAFEFNLETKQADVSKLITLMSSSSNVKGDLVFFTLTVKVKEGVKDGYYAIPFDIIGDGADKAKANRIITKDGERVPIILNPSYLGAVVKVGNPASVTTEPTTAPTPAETTSSAPVTEPTSVPTTDPTQEPPKSDAIQIILDKATYKTNEDGSIVATVPILAKNIGNGISTVQFDYEMDDTFVVDRVNKGDFECQWTPGTENKTLQFLTGDGCNIPKEGVIGKIKITVPAGTPDGVYPIKISNFEGSTYDVENDKQIPLDSSAFEGVDGEIIIGNPPSAETTVSETKPAETTAASETDKPAETTAASETDKPAETTVASETDKPAETTVASETDKPAETTVASETDKPAETTVVSQTDKPAETTVVSQTDKPAETTSSEPSGPVKGDVDDNGVVNTRDFIKLKRYLLLAADKSEVPNGDINGDKAINTIDLIHLVKMILG